IDQQKHWLVARGLQRLLELCDVADWFMVDFLYYDAAFKPARRRGARRIDRGNHNASRAGRQIQLLRDLRSQVLHIDSFERAAAVFALAGLLRLLRQFAERDGQILSLAVAPDLQFYGSSGGHLRDLQLKLVSLVNGLTIYFE